MNMTFKRKLPIPQQIKTRYPLTEEMAKVKEERDEELRKIFSLDRQIHLNDVSCHYNSSFEGMNGLGKVAEKAENFK